MPPEEPPAHSEAEHAPQTAHSEAGPTPPRIAQGVPAKWKFNGWGVIASVLAGILAVVAVAGGLYFHFGGSAPTPSLAPTAQTEAQFHNNVPEANDPSDLAGEWRLARSDHKIIAYAIARCLGVVDVDTMPKTVFSMLMLDLRPNGDHWWNLATASTASTASTPASTASTTPLKQLTGYEAAMLAISDEVARARLAATGAATEFFPAMFWFGWASVVVSAVATALVTWKASLSGNTYPKLSITGIFAVILSTAATVLTGAKQFWDPTNAYMRNETALLALRQLHAEIALTFIANSNAANCQSADGADSEPVFARWRSTLVSLESGTMRAPVIVAAQNGSATQAPANNELRHPNPGEAGRPAEKAAEVK